MAAPGAEARGGCGAAAAGEGARGDGAGRGLSEAAARHSAAPASDAAEDSADVHRLGVVGVGASAAYSERNASCAAREGVDAVGAGGGAGGAAGAPAGGASATRRNRRSGGAGSAAPLEAQVSSSSSLPARMLDCEKFGGAAFSLDRAGILRNGYVRLARSLQQLEERCTRFQDDTARRHRAHEYG